MQYLSSGFLLAQRGVHMPDMRGWILLHRPGITHISDVLTLPSRSLLDGARRPSLGPVPVMPSRRVFHGARRPRLGAMPAVPGRVLFHGVRSPNLSPVFQLPSGEVLDIPRRHHLGPVLPVPGGHVCNRGRLESLRGLWDGEVLYDARGGELGGLLGMRGREVFILHAGAGGESQNNTTHTLCTRFFIAGQRATSGGARQPTLSRRTLG